MRFWISSRDNWTGGGTNIILDVKFVLVDHSEPLRSTLRRMRNIAHAILSGDQWDHLIIRVRRERGTCDTMLSAL